MKKFMFTWALVALSLCSCAQTPQPKTYTEAEIRDSITTFFQNRLATIPDDDDDAAKAVIKSFLVSHNNDAIGVYAFTQTAMPMFLGAEEGIAIYEQSGDVVKKDSNVIRAVEAMKKQMETGPGKMFADFEAEYEGKIQRLSDYVGKGKYVLVDFWASWCGPCKAEIPTIKRVYNEFNGDKFTVLGVATWDKPEASKKTIEEFGMKWNQIINAQRAGSEAYGITGIPEIILFAPDGTIVARGLRGEAMIKAVKEALGSTE